MTCKCNCLWIRLMTIQCPSKEEIIKLSCLSSITRGVVTQSPEPEAHVLCVRAFRVAWEFRSAGFWGEGKTEIPGGKPFAAEEEPATNLAHIWPVLRIEPAPHPSRWEANALPLRQPSYWLNNIAAPICAQKHLWFEIDLKVLTTWLLVVKIIFKLET